MKLHHYLVLLIGCLQPLAAQDAAAPAAAANQNQGGTKIRSLFFQIDRPPEEVYAHDAATDGKVLGVKLELKSYLNHEFGALANRPENVVFTKSQDPASVKDPDSILAKAKLPAGLGHGIFVFMPGSGREGDLQFQVLVVDGSKRAFPSGAFRVMNLTRNPIRIELEDKKFEFKPGENKIIENPPVNANNSSAMKAFSTAGGQDVRITAQVWPNPGTKRSLQIVFQNPRTGELGVSGIRDVSDPDEF